MRIPALLLVGVVVLTGCRRPTASDASNPAPAAAPDAVSEPTAVSSSAAAPVEVGSVESLSALVSGSPSPVVRNNAKAALDAWNQKDYGSAVVFLKTVMTLPEARLQAAEVSGVIAAMQAELQRAGQGGNQSAQQALKDLAQ